MKNIAIIGAGQLGSRHLQALAKINEDVNLYIVDPSEQSLEISQQRFKEVNLSNKKLICTQKITDLPKALEFIVISTNSKQRLGVLKALLAHADVKYLLLEKFLFPSTCEYSEAASILEQKSPRVFVNCARRMWLSYQQLKESLDTTSKIQLNVSGVNWNLASNAIHFLDLFLYLLDEKEANIDTSLLENELMENKRPGYIEFAGTLTVTTQNGHKLILTSKKAGEEPMMITISSLNQYFEIDEVNQRMILNGHKHDFPMYYQSELTNKVYEQLQQTGRCQLVEYEEAMKEHLMLLNAFNEFLGEREGAIT